MSTDYKGYEKFYATECLTGKLMTKYVIVSACAPSDLDKKVNAYIQAGWKPQGGMCLDGQAYAFYQAMVKEDND